MTIDTLAIDDDIYVEENSTVEDKIAGVGISTSGRQGYLKGYEETVNDFEINLVSDSINPNEPFQFIIKFENVAREMDYNLTLEYNIKKDEIEILYSEEETINITTEKTKFSDVKKLNLNYIEVGSYLLEVNVIFDGRLVETQNKFFSVNRPILQIQLLGPIKVWHIPTTILTLLFIRFIFFRIKKYKESKKRFHENVDKKMLPEHSEKSLYLGKLAELPISVNWNTKDLLFNTLIAGTTGGGKTIGAQVIAEECLDKDISVIVFDPTAQWSGMLKPLKDKKMLALYKKFNLTKRSIGFKGNIIPVLDPGSYADLYQFMTPGEITIFTTNKLDPKDNDTFVSNSLKTLKEKNPTKELKTLIILDEVHRLLPAYGSKGDGIKEIENVCMNMAKYGVGVMLISQVMDDFIGNTKVNISSEIQMGTTDDSDIKRVKTKFGEDYYKSLIKAPTGSGLIQNANYNNGQPFFLTFRPIKHSVQRLSDEELKKYDNANNEVDTLEVKIIELKEKGADTESLMITLKLAKDKLKVGQFNLCKTFCKELERMIKDIKT